MPPDPPSPVTVPFRRMAREGVESGRFSLLGDLVRAGLRAPEREEALDATLKVRVEEALADPAPSIAPLHCL